MLATASLVVMVEDVKSLSVAIGVFVLLASLVHLVREVSIDAWNENRPDYPDRIIRFLLRAGADTLCEGSLGASKS